MFSSSFTDQHLGGTTFGVIDRRGLEVSVEDDSASGVKMSASGGAGTATVMTCGSYLISLTAGDSALATCGSLTAQVLSGEVTVELSDGTLVTIPAATTVKMAERNGGGFDITNSPDSPGTLWSRLAE